MSTYLHFDHESDGEQIASTSGWGDFTRWVESLDPDDAPLLTEFTEKGVSVSVADLTKELESNLESEPPGDANTTSVVEGLLQQLQDSSAQIVGVSVGLT